MKKLVKPSIVDGNIKAPASKSMMQRAIAAALLADGETLLKNPTFCNDSIAAMGVAIALGAKISHQKDYVAITGGSKINQKTLICGESGLCIRMFTPIAATWNESLTLDGEGSLTKRPVSMIEAPLKELGVEVKTNNGLPPITVTGPMRGGNASIDGSVSSQMLTGFLMALPKAETDSHLFVTNLKSTPYIDMTIRLLADFGIEVENQNYEVFNIKGNQTYKAREYTIEGDWSGAAFLLVAGAVSKRAEVSFIDKNSTQADKAILNALESAGAKIFYNDNTIIIERGNLCAFEIDATDCPDLFPPLAALAANCEGTSRIKGVSRLKHKESDREKAIISLCESLNISASVDGDFMLITGGKISGGVVDSFNDHRIAMAAAVMALNASDVVVINDSDCVAKSYPEFFDDMISLGAVIE